MNDRLRSAVKQLPLSGVLQSLEVRLQEAAGRRLDYAEFLELALADELAVRSDRQLKRRVKAAGFLLDAHARNDTLQSTQPLSARPLPQHGCIFG
jgi:hypothetical protein